MKNITLIALLIFSINFFITDLESSETQQYQDEYQRDSYLDENSYNEDQYQEDRENTVEQEQEETIDGSIDSDRTYDDEYYQN